jgi:hypothetical protein
MRGSRRSDFASSGLRLDFDNKLMIRVPQP